MNEATPFRAITVKASIKATGWSPEFLGPLQVLVAKVHTIVTNTFALMRYIFLTNHETTSGVVFRYLLCKHEFDLCLFDTFSTSKHYFSCSQISLRTFKQVENSR
ncbi:hypothetical protein PHYBLDRAFT_64012 [Phycomyces blakesleeanus NRRL 1555(-)]|uniref:Uncharacterized protein n=1 Tax=Phycomyces blakesleeanus (strain ATCC 8743b / DSM 1359 / FGSC 10004 / NBRC 33097 / NRRL 1555) TaxID=763407 RepID=A0A167LQP3_PHYB8|nr:hypothetical protein PHYBLDRAFT_170990 [Phycomyces blakesleeanus NRRL 1555(-)]XP_018288957.1 hypothetical protein PHYBLDRAFT_64012 [Phycomyces blakesleeanus NRRL 1555(-)]OAD70910.1 hypothetical protein PHYBLDRAFT_170990 [Phycomyces blakesleeanus NRRL 1555(-)]OAD70917.1 hypothetical protein PHYBLDRAFT_64012 [Phycomyces blakesleeanus NRRL 1555(-)]|eukprot:XP_018288950.1 hypothetical protein PHYBLDRAFT_170990 [Phycomyces blakesleeanus NRRL 1555(-)]